MGEEFQKGIGPSYTGTGNPLMDNTSGPRDLENRPYDPGALEEECLELDHAQSGPGMERPMADENMEGVGSEGTQGRSGGMVIAWKSSNIQVSVLEEDSQFFHIKCHNASIPVFFLTAIYAFPHSNHREVLWQKLWRFSQGISDPWSVVGDFNDICSMDERIGGRNGDARRMRWFCDRINECGLADLGASGPRMTWKGPRLVGCSRLYERLDRALANCSMLHSLPESFLKGWPSFVQCDGNLLQGDTDGRTDAVWRPPPSEWLKLNVDGAVTASGRAAGCGGVLRDSRGLCSMETATIQNKA
ncbi:hypothetical protein K1719_010649 [Acacia pycnantha]|nr:hypothetical protein K1719_010649 [Acacia pycnantha]